MLNKTGASCNGDIWDWDESVGSGPCGYQRFYWMQNLDVREPGTLMARKTCGMYLFAREAYTCTYQETLFPESHTVAGGDVRAESRDRDTPGGFHGQCTARLSNSNVTRPSLSFVGKDKRKGLEGKKEQKKKTQVYRCFLYRSGA